MVSASAECAWVLWEERAGWRAWVGWGASPVRSFDSRHACEEMQRLFILFGANAHALDAETRNNAVTLGYKEGASYLCLPDTIDPRGPKGSGR